MNPFRYGQVVKGDDFCPRPEFLRQIRSFIKSGQNLALAGERRVGKTSLICKAASEIDDLNLIYIDLMEVKTADDLCRRMIRAVARAESHETLLTRLLRSLASLRPSLTMDPVSGQPSLSLDSRVVLNAESLESILDIIGETGERRRILVVFDEFQDILNLNDSNSVLAMLRSRIQFQGSIPYIFAGSIRNRMNMVFFDPESPFFKSAQALEIGPIDTDGFCGFLKARFRRGRRKVSEGLLKEVMLMFDLIPGDVQEFCSALWDRTSPGDEITEAQFEEAFALVFAREFRVYEQMLVQISAQQMKCVAALARMGGGSPYSSEFMDEAGIAHPGSVRAALKNLQKKKILFEKNGEIRFSNPYFKQWLLRKGY